MTFTVQLLPSRDTHGCHLCGTLPITFGELSAGYLVRQGQDVLPSCGFHLDTTMTMWKTIQLEVKERRV